MLPVCSESERSEARNYRVPDYTSFCERLGPGMSARQAGLHMSVGCGWNGANCFVGLSAAAPGTNSVINSGFFAIQVRFRGTRWEKPKFLGYIACDSLVINLHAYLVNIFRNKVFAV